jgi:hypothetical protein
MTIDWGMVAKVAMPIVTLFLGVIVNRYLESREKLIAHLGYCAVHKLKPKEDGKPGTTVHTHSVIVKNSGNKSAKNVRLGHNFLPDVNVYPDIEYFINDLPGGGKEIVFPNISPKKEVTVSYLYFPPDIWPQVNTHIESDEGPAKIVQVLLQVQPKPVIIKIIWGLIIAGIISIVYGLVELAMWLM